MAADDGASQRRADAPHPEDERKPDSPREITKRSWMYVFRKSYREFIDDECPDRAGSLTYFGVLALFPGLLAMASLLALVGQGERAIDALLEVVGQVAPGEALDVVREPLEQYSTSPAAGFGFVTGLVVSIWSASGYIGAFTRAMNRIYEIDEGRPFWKLRPMQLVVPIALYVANFPNYDRTYGSLAGVIVFLLWLWLANCALLFGAEFDAELERGRQLQAGIEAEEDIQLPPRDTRRATRPRRRSRRTSSSAAASGSTTPMKRTRV